MRLRRRARRVHAARATVETRVTRWRAEGGVVGLVAPERHGRTWILDRVWRDLRARTEPVVRIEAWPLPFEGILQALRDPSLTTPPEGLPDGLTHEEAVAHATVRLTARFAGTRPRILVDDLEDLDAGTRAVIERLGTGEAADMLVLSGSGPAWSGANLDLGPVDDLVGWLGEVLRDKALAGQLASRVADWLEGSPARAIDWLEHAIQVGALVPHPAAWRIHGTLPDHAPRPTAPPEASGIAAALHAWSGPMPLAALLVADDPSGADAAGFGARVDALVEHDLIDVRGDVVCVRGPRARPGLDPRDSGRSVAERLLTVTDPSVRRTVLLAAAGQADWIRAEGPTALDQLALLDPRLAAEVGATMEAVAPGAALAVSRLKAYVRAGDPAAALAAARQSLASRARSPDDADLYGEIAILLLARGALPEAERAVQQALALISGAPPLAVTWAQARILQIQGDPRQAIAVAAPRLRTPPTAGEADAWGRLAVLALETLEALGSPEDTSAFLTSLPSASVRGPSGARIATAGARALAGQGHFDEAASRLADAIRAAGPTCPAIEQAALAEELAATRSRLGERLDLIRAWEDARAAAEAAGRADAAAEACLVLSEAHRSIRNFSEADRYARAASDRVKTREIAARARTAHAWSAAGRGAWAEAAEIALASHEAGDPDATALLAWASVRTGAPNAALGAAAAEAGRAAGGQRAVRGALLAALVAGGSPEPETWASLARGWASYAPDVALAMRLLAAEVCAVDPPAAQDHLEQAVSLAREMAHLAGLQDALFALGPPRSPTLASVLAEATDVGHERGPDAEIDALLAGTLQILPYDRAYLIRSSAPGQPPGIRAARGRSGPTTQAPCAAVVRRVHATGRALVIASADLHPVLARNTTVRASGARAFCSVPLTARGSVVGVLHLESGSPRVGGAGDLAIATAIAAFAETATHRAGGAGSSDAARTLREPLGNVLIATSSLRNALAGRPDALRTLDGITAATRQVLDAARRLGSEDTPTVAVDLVRLTLDALIHLAPAAVARGVRLDATLIPHAVATGDPEHLTHLLAALITHAVKYTGAGDSVEVSLAAAGERITWIIRDRGTGVPDGELPLALLDPSTPGSAGRSPLAAAAAIARRHGGTLALGQRPTGGAVVRVELPRHKGPP